MTIKEGFAKIPTFFKWLGKDLKEIGITFREGGFKTRISYLIMGLGQLLRGQYVRGIAMLAGQIALLAFIFGFGGQYLVQLGTLGTRARITNPNGTVSYGDNSFFILLYGILTIVVILLYLLLWRINLKQNHEADQLLAKGKKLPSNRSDLSSLLNRNFDKTLLALPVIGIFVFTVLPILFMIGVAFTNYDFNHQPPGKLFSWVGFENFKKFALIYDMEKEVRSPISWLQSMDEPLLALPVVSPLDILGEYNPIIEDELTKIIGNPADADLLILVSMTIPSDITKVTANLKAPFIINAKDGKAMQVIVENQDYDIRFNVYDFVEKLKKKEGE